MNNYVARIIFTGLIFFFLLTANSPGQQSVERPEAQRRNIGLFYEKIRTGKAVTVAYLGGSITQGAGATDPNKTSYRALVTTWLRTHFPKTQINEINAAVGGTGSAYGSIRVRRDVVEQKPDLVFIEFAINDAGEKEEAAKKSLEGIIRQLLAVSQPPEIVMIYTTSEKRNAVVAWHETIASYYRLPAINLQDAVWKQIDEGKISFSALSKDGVHPNDDGYKLYANLVTDFLTVQETLTPSPLVKVLPGYLLSDEMTYGELKPFAEFAHNATWKSEATTDKTLPSSLLVTDKANAEISVSFEGTVVGLSYRMGPDCGIIECLIDDKPAPDPLRQIDTYYKDHHISTRIIAGGLPPGEHKLTIRVKGEKNAKSTGNFVRLGAFLIGGARPERL